MLAIKILFSFFIVITFLFGANAQITDIIQVKGMVVNIHFEPISFVHILIINKKRGTVSDESGKFDFFAEKGDTLQFSSIGYKKSSYYIPTITTSKIFFTVPVLKADTTILKEVIILPWKNYKEFEKIFVETKVIEDDIYRAEKNIALIKFQMLVNDDDIPSAPGAAYNLSMQQRVSQLYWKGQTQPLQILNYVAWAKFLDYIKNGKFKNPNKKRKK
jgi:hypothetical protein